MIYKIFASSRLCVEFIYLTRTPPATNSNQMIISNETLTQRKEWSMIYKIFASSRLCVEFVYLTRTPPATNSNQMIISNEILTQRRKDAKTQRKERSMIHKIFALNLSI
jgi:hypothetical protein